jgi:hypothetical protein
MKRISVVGHDPFGSLPAMGHDRGRPKIPKNI